MKRSIFKYEPTVSVKVDAWPPDRPYKEFEHKLPQLRSGWGGAEVHITITGNTKTLPAEDATFSISEIGVLTDRVCFALSFDEAVMLRDKLVAAVQSFDGAVERYNSHPNLHPDWKIPTEMP